jgi:TPR repeat protein
MSMTTNRFFNDQAGQAKARQAIRGGILLAAILFGLLGQAGLAAAQTPAVFDPAPLQANAASGNVTAEFQLGTLDYVGLTVVQDYIAAIDLLKQAGTAGNAEALCEAGFLYQTGSFAQGPPPPDLADAAAWYEKAAALGNPWGEFALAALYQSGQGVPQDAAKAAALFTQATAQGVVEDPASFPLEQLQKHFYGIAYQVTGQTQWADSVSTAAGGGQ